MARFFKGQVPWNKGIKLSSEQLSTMNMDGLLLGRGWNRGTNGLTTAWNKGTRMIKICLFCKKEFKALSNRYKYCGQKCKGLSHCGENNVNWKKKLTPKQKQFLTEVGLKGLIKQQTSKDPTSIEVKLYRELKNLGLLFETQKLINGKFIVDAYIPSLNLVIEADGDYWHSLDKVMKKDKAENAYLTKCGFKLLRFAEHEINDGSFKERLVN